MESRWSELPAGRGGGVRCPHGGGVGGTCCTLQVVGLEPEGWRLEGGWGWLHVLVSPCHAQLHAIYGTYRELLSVPLSPGL